MPSPARPSAVQKQLDQLQLQREEDSLNQDLFGQLQLENPAAASKSAESQGSQKNSSKNKDMSQWFSLFADLDPLANPDAIGKGTKEADPNCYS